MGRPIGPKPRTRPGEVNYTVTIEATIPAISAEEAMNFARGFLSMNAWTVRGKPCYSEPIAVARQREEIPMRKTVYLVVIDGAGEYRDSYDVLKIAADSPQAAVDYAISKGMGYGQETDGKAFVVPYATVSSFAITPTSKKVASPSTSPLQDLPRQEAK